MIALFILVFFIIFLQKGTIFRTNSNLLPRRTTFQKGGLLLKIEISSRGGIIFVFNQFLPETP